MEGQLPVEVGREASVDAGETEVCRASKQKQQQQQQQRLYCLEKEVEYLNEDDDEDIYPEDMTAGSSINNNNRTSSVSPQEGSMNRKVSVGEVEGAPAGTIKGKGNKGGKEGK